MAENIVIRPASTSVLAMDFLNEILDLIPEQDRVRAIDNGTAVLGRARNASVQVIHVAVRFRDGYPEVSARNKIFSMAKATNWLREGTPGANFHDQLAPLTGEPVVTKRRVGAFSTTDLDTLLRARNVTTLILFGVFTSGVMLSTVRWAADMDYELIVVRDACADPDPDVHRVLVEKVFPQQATVVTTKALLAAMLPSQREG